MIKGNIIELIPAALCDKQRVYDWCFHSETTKSHTGPPDYSENPISTWEEFFDEGYEDYFFTGAESYKGRGFIIMREEQAVGFISYCSFHLKPKKAELDIWLNSERHCGKGYGTDAIVALGEYLNAELGVDEIIMRPSVRNLRAIRAYAKAGLSRTDRTAADFLLLEYMPLYGDGEYGAGGDALLCKRFWKEA